MGQVIVFNMLPAVPGLILAFSLFWILGAFPGVNMIWGMVIAFVLAAFIAVRDVLIASASEGFCPIRPGDTLWPRYARAEGEG